MSLTCEKNCRIFRRGVGLWAAPYKGRVSMQLPSRLMNLRTHAFFSPLSSAHSTSSSPSSSILAIDFLRNTRSTLQRVLSSVKNIKNTPILLVEKTIQAIEISPNFAFMENLIFCCGCVDDAHWLSAAGVMCRCVGDRGCDTSFRPPTSIGLAYPIIITTMITMAINDYHHHQNH